jgi:hypothetical protein
MHRHERRKNPALRQRVDELIAHVRAAEEAVVARGLDAVRPGDAFTVTGTLSSEPSSGRPGSGT